MAKLITISLRITKEQEQILETRARAAGFFNKSEYIRMALFRPMPVEEKIDKIFRKVCGDG